MRETFYITCKQLVAHCYSGLTQFPKKILRNFLTAAGMLDTKSLSSKTTLIGGMLGGLGSIYKSLRAYQNMTIYIKLIIAALFIIFPVIMIEMLLRGSVGNLEQNQLSMIRLLALMVVG